MAIYLLFSIFYDRKKKKFNLMDAGQLIRLHWIAGNTKIETIFFSVFGKKEKVIIDKLPKNAKHLIQI